MIDRSNEYDMADLREYAAKHGWQLPEDNPQLRKLVSSMLPSDERIIEMQNELAESRAREAEMEKARQQIEQDRLKQKTIAQYDQLVQEKNRASTESEFRDLAGKFRLMGNHKDAVSLAMTCDSETSRLLEIRRNKEAAQKRAEAQRSKVLLLLQLGAFAIFLYALFGADIIMTPVGG